MAKTYSETDFVHSHNRWYEKLMEVSPVGIFFTDVDGNCLHVNQRWCEIAGMSPEQVRGRGWVQAIYKDDLDQVAQKWYEAARNNKPFHSEYRFCTPNGEVTWVIGNARSILTDDEKIAGYVGTITDISKAKEAYLELEHRSSWTRTIVQQMPVILFAFNEQDTLCVWNREAEIVTGYAAEDMIGNPEAMQVLCPDSDYCRAMLDIYKQRGNDYRNWDWQLRAKDGSIKEITFSNISKYYPIEGWANWGVGVDVTDSRKAQHDLRERVKELTCLYKLSILSNQTNLSLDCFLQEAVALLPQSWQYPEITCARVIYEDRIFTSEKFESSPWKQVSYIHRRGKKFGQIEVYYTEQKPEDAEGPFMLEERMLLDEIALQISRTIDHVLAREDQTLINELSARAEELKQFSHSVSHDLRTPLTAIGGYAQFLKKKLSKGDVAEAQSCAHNIINITDRMEVRLNELLKLAKIGKIIEPNEKVDLREIIEEILSMLAKRLDDAEISVELNGDLPMVIGDRTRLTEVFENLLDNAIKYIGNPPNRISIGCREDNGNKVFYCKDNGIGIDAEHFEDVFQLFWRLHKNGPGDGTGLAIVKRIIEAHGGRIWVESKGKGMGSLFCFTLGHVIIN